MPALPATTKLQFEAFKGRSLSIMLFKDVQNSKELRQKVLASEVEVELALLNAALVADLFPLQLAAHKALEAAAAGKLATKSLNVELLAHMSGSKHVGDSIKRFGLSDNTRHLLVARFDATPADVEYVAQLVQGEAVPLEQLQQLHDPELITKAYKITKPELTIGSLGDAVACRIGSRECS